MGVREQLESMGKNFSPEAAKDWNRVLQFVITGEGGGSFYFVIKDQKCTLMEGEHESPDMKITTDIDAWNAMLRGEISGTTAYMSGRLSAEGPMSDLMRVTSVFPGLF